MKKIITLLFCVGVFSTSFAQYNHQMNDERIFRTENGRNDQYVNSSNGDQNYGRDNRDWRYRGNENNYVNARDFQIQKINGDFDARINAIQCDRYMRRREKREAIRSAEFERSNQIQMVNARFSNNHYWNH